MAVADVAELADAPGLGPGVRKDMGVRIPPSAPGVFPGSRPPAWIEAAILRWRRARESTLVLHDDTVAGRSLRCPMAARGLRRS